MREQRTLSSVVYDSKRKVTRRERFLQAMDAVIPWAQLEALVAPHYPKPGRGRRPLPLRTMLRVHSLVTTDAGAADITQVPHLLRGAETTLHGDKAYYKADDKLQWELSGGRYLVNKSGKRTPYWNAINRTRSRTRARVEHVFHVIKRLWGFAKVRYHGLAKNTVRVYAACALANLYLVRHRLTPQGT